MKKVLKYLSFIFVTFATATTVSNAAISVGQKQQGQFGYTHQTQTFTSGSCSTTIYCIDKGKANQKSFAGCTASPVSFTGDISKLSVQEQEYLFRVAAWRANLTKVNYTGSSIANGTYYNDLLKKAGLSDFSFSTGSSSIIKQDGNYSYNQIDNSNVSVTITLPGTNFSAGDFKVQGGTITGFSNSGGTYTFTITGFTVNECDNKDIKINLKGYNSNNNSNSASGYYFISCPNGKQSYIVNTTSQCSIDTIMSESDDADWVISVSDLDCDCSGTTNLCQECQTNGTTTDLKNPDMLKKCANLGNNNKDPFKHYCSTSIKKTTNNDTGTTQVAARGGGNVTPSAYLKDNPYCSVFCLEEIEYKMPGVLKTKDGRYFKLIQGWDIEKNNDSGERTSIKGTRKCVTSEVKVAKYKDDIETAQDSVLKAYNDYLKEKAKKAYYDNGSVKCTNTNTPNACPSDKLRPDGTCKINPGTTCTSKTCTLSDNGEKYKVKSVTYNGYDKSVNSITESDDTWKETYTTTDCSKAVSKSDFSESADANPSAKASIITAKLNEMYTVINKYKSCFEWTNNYCFDPKANFSYSEVYNDDMEGELPIESTTKGSQVESYYGDVSDDYSGSASGYSNHFAHYIYADTSTIDSSNDSRIDVDHKYIKKEVTSERKFKEGTKEVYSYHPYGTIVYDKNCDGNKCTSLGYALPVALEHNDPTGVYLYNITFSDVGVAGDDVSCDQPNRINGKSCSSTNVEGQCETDYTCRYETTKCPECEIECVCPDGDTTCYVEDKVCKWVVCDECEVSCVGCVWNGGDTAINYKTISLNDVYANDEEIGSNWTEEEIKEIEDKGQQVYEKEPLYSFTLTPTTMGKIREYNTKSLKGNKDNIPTGGYNSDTLTCENRNNSVINCKSSFIRKFLPKESINGKLPE